MRLIYFICSGDAWNITTVTEKAGGCLSILIQGATTTFIDLLIFYRFYWFFIDYIDFIDFFWHHSLSNRIRRDVTLRRGHAEYAWGQGSMLGHCVTSGVLLNMHKVRGQCLVIMWRQRSRWICMRSEFQMCMRWKRDGRYSKRNWRNLWRNCDAFDAIWDAFDAIRDAFDVIRRSSWRNWRN